MPSPLLKRILDRDPRLTKLRESLADVEALMRGGVFTDDDTGRDYFTGYDYKTLYDWDQYFEAIVQAYMGWPSATIKNAVLIFLDHQQPDGLVSRSVPSNEFHDPEHVKPFLAQTILLVRRIYGELDWFTADYYDKLKRYLDYWLEEMDSTGNGLSEWMSAPHTGMDNHHERAGHWGDRICKGVDLNCYLVRELEAFSYLAEAFGHTRDREDYGAKAQELRERVREMMWHEEDGIFYDTEVETGAPLRVKYVGAFAPLWANVATQNQARVLIQDHLFNPEAFWSPFPVATLARSERGYSQTPLPGDLGCNWRATTWVPTNYMVYHGLRNYGYDQLAAILVHATTALLDKAGNREYYNAETGEGLGLDPFWGWSLLGHFMPYEETAPFDITNMTE